MTVITFFFATQVSGVALVGMIIVSFTIVFMMNPTFYEAGWQLWFAGAILPLIGYAIGYGFAFLLRQSHKKCLAIAFETGSQNVAFGFTITVMSFANTDLFVDMIFYPILYSIFICVDSAFVLVAYWIYAARKKDKKDKKPNEELKEVINVPYEIDTKNGKPHEKNFKF